MTSKQVEKYVEAAVEGRDGIDMEKPPTDPQNEKNFENAEGMSASEAKEFEKDVKETFRDEDGEI